MSLKSRVYNQARVIMACVRYIHSVVINFGHKYMSVEGNYAAKIKLIIQNESNLSKLSPCAWPYIWRFRLFNFLKCKFFSNILASFPPCKIEKLSFFPISLKKNPINIWKSDIIPQFWNKNYPVRDIWWLRKAWNKL